VASATGQHPRPRRNRHIDETGQVQIVATIDRLAYKLRPAGRRALTGHPKLLRIRVGD
jgi:hypothetical protein